MLSFLKKRWYVFIILLILGGIFSYKVLGVGQKKKETAYTVKRQTLKETLSLSGKIEAEEKVTLRFQTSGRLSWVGVKEGDYVKKYQAIASLDQKEVKKTLDKYLSDYLKYRWDFEQTKDDYKNSVTTTAISRIIDKAQFDLNKSVLDVEIKNLAVEFASLATPIEGIVTKVDSSFAGTNITPAQAEFEVVNPKTIYFSALADQTEVVGLKEKLKGEIVLDSFPDKTIAGQIKSISFTPKTGESGTVYEVKIFLNDTNDGYHYRLGMTGDANFVIKEKGNVLSIPLSSVKAENGKKYVFKKAMPASSAGWPASSAGWPASSAGWPIGGQENGKKVKTYIKLGEGVDDVVEVKKGLEEGDIIY